MAVICKLCDTKPALRRHWINTRTFLSRNNHGTWAGESNTCPDTVKHGEATRNRGFCHYSLVAEFIVETVTCESSAVQAFKGATSHPMAKEACRGWNKEKAHGFTTKRAGHLLQYHDRTQKRALRHIRIRGEKSKHSLPVILFRI